MELVLATRNPHKLREAARILRPYGLAVLPLPDTVALPPEDGATFAANALGKARAGARALDRAVIADDSGLEAAALAGGPGVRSARYAGEPSDAARNLAKLQREVPAGSALRYVCALAYVGPGGGPLAAPVHPAVLERVFCGTCTGVMAAGPRGARGFGYDPVFVADAAGAGRTVAELSAAEKDAISHRGAALRALARWLTDARTAR